MDFGWIFSTASKSFIEHKNVGIVNIAVFYAYPNFKLKILASYWKVKLIGKSLGIKDNEKHWYSYGYNK